jgi:hypothetical protein
VALPEHPPPFQPVKLEPVSGVAVSVTVVPAGKLCEQLPGHEIDASSLEIVPEPVPAAAAVSSGAGAGPNVAVTLLSESIVTVQVGIVPLGQPPPLQPVNTEPLGALAVRTTVAPDGATVAHRCGHEIEPTSLVTVPDPLPSVATSSE